MGHSIGDGIIVVALAAAFVRYRYVKHRERQRAGDRQERLVAMEFAGGAEEVTQEVFVRAHYGIVSFRGDATFSSWLYHYRMGAGVGEIATLIGVPGNTVKSCLHRARRLLHAMLRNGDSAMPEQEHGPVAWWLITAACVVPLAITALIVRRRPHPAS